MKTKADLLERLEDLDACRAAVAWVQAFPHDDFSALWADCQRADWMLWLAAHTLDRRVVVRAACLCAREALVHVSPGELRPLRAIETAEAWMRGEATVEDVRTAAAAAVSAANAADTHAAADAAYAAAAAADAADAANAAYAANAANTAAADNAAYAAAHAAYVAEAAYEAAYAASADAASADAASAASLRRSADLVRSVIGAEAFDGKLVEVTA